MSDRTSSPHGTAASATCLSPEVQSAISLGLFVHLFMIFVAVSSYVAPSDLQARLHRLFAPYLQTLNFNLNHTYGSSPRLYLTHASLTDVDFTVEVSADLSDPKADRRTLPPAGLELPIRRRRYQNLANAMGSVVQNENAESILPRAVGGALLNQLQAEHGELRIRRHLLLGMEEMASADSSVRDPFAPAYYQTAYEAQLLTGGGSIELMKKSEARDVAPVERRGAARTPADRADPARLDDTGPNPFGASRDVPLPSALQAPSSPSQPSD